MFSLSDQPIDSALLKHAMSNPRIGGLVSFEGWVRNHNDGKTVVALEYEAFEVLAQSEARKILAEARERFAIEDCHCVHRVGRLSIGDLAVWVGVGAAHRGAAFAACRYIIDEIKARLPIWKKEYYDSGDSGWVNCQTCAGDGHSHASLQESVLPFEPSAYYARQICLPEVKEGGQAKLRDSRVLVVGAGGLGSPALMYLAAAGIGTLGICEFDRLEASNLHRQVLYGWQEVGQSKADLAARQIERLNPFVTVKIHRERLTPGNIESVLRQYDLVLDCTDNFATKFLINDAAVLAGIPLIQASIYQYEGQLQLCAPVRGMPCLRCLWPEMPEPDCVGTCSEVGVLGSVPGVLGAMQAMEALKLILELPTGLSEHLLMMNLLTYEVNRIRWQPNKACPICGEAPSITYLEPERYDSRQSWEVILSPQGIDELATYRVVDIREPEECVQDPLPWEPHEAIPMREIMAHLSVWDRQIPTLLVCQKGVRSRRLASELRQAGMDTVFSLAGGVASLQGCQTDLATTASKLS